MFDLQIVRLNIMRSLLWHANSYSEYMLAIREVLVSSDYRHQLVWITKSIQETARSW